MSEEKPPEIKRQGFRLTSPSGITPEDFLDLLSDVITVGEELRDKFEEIEGDIPEKIQDIVKDMIPTTGMFIRRVFEYYRVKRNYYWDGKVLYIPVMVNKEKKYVIVTDIGWGIIDDTDTIDLLDGFLEDSPNRTTEPVLSLERKGENKR